MSDRYAPMPQLTGPGPLLMPAPPVYWQPEPPTSCASLLRLALMGATMGGAGAAAANLRRLRDGETQGLPAVADTLRGAAIGAVATAAAGAVAGTIADQGIARLALTFAVATAVVYGIQELGQGVDDV